MPTNTNTMASNSNSNSEPYFTVAAGECSQKLSLPVSVPIRAPPTLDDSDSDVSSNAAASDTATASDSDDFHPSVALPEEEADNVSQGNFEVDNSTSLRVMPFAHLSTYDDDDDDEDEGEDEESEAEFDVPRNFVVAPRIKVQDNDDDDEEEEQEENDVALMFKDSSSLISVNQSLLANELTFFNDAGSDNSIEAYDEYSIATDSDAMSQYSLDNLNDEQFGKVRRVVEVALNESEKNEEMELCDVDRNERIAVKSIEGDSVRDAGEVTSMMVGDAAGSYGDSDCRMMMNQNGNVDDIEKQNSLLDTDFCLTGEPVSDAFAENIEYGTIQSTAASGSEGFAVDGQSEREKPVSVTESAIDSKVKLLDSSASFESSDDDACKGNNFQSVDSSKFLDPTLVEEGKYLEIDLSENVLVVSREDELFCNYHSHEHLETEMVVNLGDTVKKEATVDLSTLSEEVERDGSASDGDAEGMMSVGLEQFVEHISALSILLGSKGSGKNCQDEQTIKSSHEKTNLPRDDAERQLICVDGGGESDGNRVAIMYADESGVIFLEDPAGFSSLPRLEAQVGFRCNISEKEKEKVQQIQAISVKFLRLVQRVNLSLEDSLVSKVLCRLVADIGKCFDQEFLIKSAKILAKKLEEDFQDDLDFSLNILVIGKSGVGKSATINSIFGDMKVMTNAFEPATTSVKEVSGALDGVKIRILDTPGLRCHMKEQAFNRKILSSIKRYTKKFPIDVILYVDRLDAQTRDLNDLPILRSITSSLSPSIWQRAILTLTHAASTPLDGPSGSPLSYEVFVAQKSYLVQQSINQAVGDLCQLNPSFMCPVSLVENHSLCGKNISGECVLPSGLRWRSQLLALCFSLKILSEVSSFMSGPQNVFDHWKHFFFQNHSPPLSHVFSSLLQSPPHVKFSANWN